jgi:anti-sigma-K factor RskA
MSDLHDLAPFYVLGALDDEERLRFEEHLPSCPDCTTEISELSGGVEVLARSVAVVAPEELRPRVMEEIDRPAVVVPLRRRLWLGAAAVAAIVSLVPAIGRPDAEARLEQLLAAPDVRTLEVEASVGSVQVVVSTTEGRAALVADRLSPTADDETYQLWLIGSDGPVSAGLFRPDGDGRVIAFLEGDVLPGQVVGLTREPAGGSPAPTGEVLAAVEI